MCRMSIFFLIVSLLFIPYAMSQDNDQIKVFVENGNICARDESGKIMTLTYTGRDSEPVLHPNGNWVYFVRTFEGETEDEQYYGIAPEDGILKEELWRIDIDGQNEKMLYKNSTAAIDHPSGYAYASLDNPQISPNGDKIYFETAMWVTSNALHVMDPDGSNVKMLGPGNEMKIIFSTGDSERDFTGYIVTNQHRYWFFGGSYDWYWLYTPDWKEVGPLGPDMEYFTGIWDIKYTDHSEKKFLQEANITEANGQHASNNTISPGTKKILFTADDKSWIIWSELGDADFEYLYFTNLNTKKDIELCWGRRRPTTSRWMIHALDPEIEPLTVDREKECFYFYDNDFKVFYFAANKPRDAEVGRKTIIKIENAVRKEIGDPEADVQIRWVIDNKACASVNEPLEGDEAQALTDIQHHRRTLFYLTFKGDAWHVDSKKDQAYEVTTVCYH